MKQHGRFAILEIKKNILYKYINKKWRGAIDRILGATALIISG